MEVTEALKLRDELAADIFSYIARKKDLFEEQTGLPVRKIDLIVVPVQEFNSPNETYVLTGVYIDIL